MSTETGHLAEVWLDDPDGTYDKTIANLERCFRDGVISGAECGMGRGVAERCRDQAKARHRRS